MNILAWNCRGAGGPRKRRFLVRTLQATRAGIAFVTETKSSLHKSKLFLDELQLSHYSVVPSRGRSGGLWLIWDQRIDLQVIYQNLFYIHAKVKTDDGKDWSLVCVYGDPSHRHGKELWRELELIVEREGAVCMIGDFNEIVSEKEKVGGNPVLASHSRDFKRFLSNAGLVDLGYKGPAYTWTNTQFTSKPIFERLDRVVATSEWLSVYPEAYVNHLPRVHSDHAPILLRTKQEQKRPRNFKFENWWLNTTDFKKVCDKAWGASEHETWSKRMENMTKSMKDWAKQTPTPQNRIREAQHNLFCFQHIHPTMQDPKIGEELLREFNNAEDDLEEYWRQRSRTQWQVHGDRNTKFFHLTATQRKRRNLIGQITNERGEIVTEEKEITRVFVRYFKNLYKEEVRTEMADIDTYIQNGGQQDNIAIHDAEHANLNAPPNLEEVRANLFRMGPDKAPGPDGLTTRFLQTNWELLKHDLVKAIGTVFQSQQTPTDWLASHMILIPKIDQPTTPSEYRPITIGNIVYRLLMKIIASRLQVHMQSIISNNQTAFLKNRSISDNTIVIREVLHSFNSKGYGDKDFLLKADINKAFDMVRWNFVEASLKAVNMPTKLRKIIMAAMASSRVKILINGHGDGFITPSRGLRQGCPLSPYLFILVMEMLTRRVKKSLVQGKIEGVRLAATAPLLTTILYADDLIIMGKASGKEAKEYKKILDEFELNSGLYVNPQKSKIWYSRSCDEGCKGVIEQELGAQRANPSEKYLGVIMTQGGDQHELTRQMLVDRVGDKLASWKVHTLSHAGRMVLIKSTLTSIPVYYMSIEKLTTKTIENLTTKIRSFFWGKLQQERYVSMIAWHKLCRDWNEGGLGIKDIKSFNQALMLKLVWHILEGSDRIWVQILIAKYTPKGGVWGANTNRGGSKLWRALQGFKSFFKEAIKWHIGDGSNIAVFNQPWYEGWRTTRIATNLQRDAKVKQLYDQNRRAWRLEEIGRIMGQTAMLQITQTAMMPTENPAIKDQLIWTASVRGRYTVKEGYTMLHNQNMQQVIYSPEQKFMWKKIWSWKGVLPRIKIFLWRACHEGIPTQMAMHKRIQKINPTCQRCGKENEFTSHIMFSCPSARATWCASQYPIRVEMLPLNFTKALQVITEDLQEEQIPGLCNIIWELWKARNEEIFRGIKANPIVTLTKARSLAYTLKLKDPQSQTQTQQEKAVTVPTETRVIQIDGSWEVSNMAGIGMTQYSTQGILELVHCTNCIAQDPLQAEALSLDQAIVRITHGTGTYLILTDSSVLAHAIQEESIDKLPSWEAAQVVAKTIQRIKQREGKITVQKVGRRYVKQAHNLANWARQHQMAFHGYPSAGFRERMEIDTHIGRQIFQYD